MHDNNGSRKYLDVNERSMFSKESRALSNEAEAFCRILTETGCRISEALKIRSNHIDTSNKIIRIESLKRRKSGIYRSIPVSDALIRKLSSTYRLNQISHGHEISLWTWSRTTAYRLVVSVMRDAGIQGPHATPRGLRHGFAVAALDSGVPITLVQRWLGHASLKTTAIYTEVVGREERRIASRMWRRHHTRVRDNSTLLSA